MRNQGFVDLGDGRQAIVKELRVRDARNMFAMAELLETMSMTDILTSRFSDAVNLLDDGIQMPAGETLEDLTISEMIEVKNKWLEINSHFLDLIGLALSPVPAAEKSPELQTSTELASS